MEIPDLVGREAGDEGIESAVNLGDESLVCFTPTRTLLYSGDSLLSDESIEVFAHDAERLAISEGRRKTAFTLEYVDRQERFKIPAGRTEPVLERLLDGVLGTTGVIERDESIGGVFRFSELTIVVTEARLLKHIGGYVWDADYQEYRYADVTGLEFEEGSVATQIVLSVDGRPQRIKAPSDEAELLRRTLTEALFGYYDVRSLDKLNDAVGADEQAPDATDDDGFVFDDSISPLVEDTGTSTPANPDSVSTTDSVDAGDSDSLLSSSSGGDSAGTDASGHRTSRSDTAGETVSPSQAIDPEDFEELEAQVSELRTAVERQNEMLDSQHETIQQLIEELRRQY